MVLQIDRPNKDDINDKFMVVLALNEVLNKKKLEYPDLKFINYKSVNLDFSCK
jgi:hypothetical protein